MKCLILLWTVLHFKAQPNTIHYVLDMSEELYMYVCISVLLSYIS